MARLYVVEYWFWSKGKRSSWNVWPEFFVSRSEAVVFAKKQALEGGAKAILYKTINNWAEVSA